MMVGSVVWLVHNAVVWTPAAVLVEASFLLGNIAGYYRFNWKAMSTGDPT